MTLYQRFVTEGNARADELAKDVAMLDGGWRRSRPRTVQQKETTVWWRSGTIVKSFFSEADDTDREKLRDIRRSVQLRADTVTPFVELVQYNALRPETPSPPIRHHALAITQARAGAQMTHHPVWVGHLTGGSG